VRQFVEHESTRLRLLAWRERHIAPFVAMNSDPEVMRYFPSLIDEEQSRASVDFWMKQFAERGWSNWAVELKDTDEFIGFVGLWTPKLTMPFSPCVEIGWRLARRFWGRGYATEGANASLRVGFEQLGLTEIVSYTALPNAPSRAVMERIGMHNTGADFDHPAVPVGHALRRHCLYKITRQQWAVSAASPP
jgi:RimJ/RimL family protein N-acetyltransferase